MNSEYPNLYIYMEDALRRDFWPFPEGQNEYGITVPAKAAGHHTPESFTSILTGLMSDEHGVKRFPESVDVPTVFEMSQKGYDVSFWDHPDDVTYKVYRFPQRKPLEELEEPFIFIHRDTATHAPYPTDWKMETMEKSKGTEGRVYPEVSGPEYIQKMADGEVNYRKDYRDAVERAVKYFKQDLKKLKEMGVYENTFKVFCSDHGDCWPDDGYDTLAHAQEVPPVMDVAVTFFDHDIEISDELFGEDGEFNVVDILRVWSDWDSLRGDLHVKGAVEEEQDELEEKVKDRLRDLGYVDDGKEEEWRTFTGKED